MTDYLQQQDPNDLRNIVLQQERRIAALERALLNLNDLGEVASSLSTDNVQVGDHGMILLARNEWEGDQQIIQWLDDDDPETSLVRLLAVKRYVGMQKLIRASLIVENDPNETEFLLSADNLYLDSAVGLAAPHRKYMVFILNDLFDIITQASDGLIVAILGTYGNVSKRPMEQNHPGIIGIEGGWSSGGRIYVNNANLLLLSGGETFELCFCLKSTGGLVARLGFLDVFTTGAPVDGVWFDIAGANITGKTASNSSVSTTATSYTLLVNTWYRLKLKIDSISLATFALYDSSDRLWQDSLNTNIPAITGRETGMGALVYKTSAGSAQVMDIDWIACYKTVSLNR